MGMGRGAWILPAQLAGRTLDWGPVSPMLGGPMLVLCQEEHLSLQALCPGAGPERHGRCSGIDTGVTLQPPASPRVLAPPPP